MALNQRSGPKMSESTGDRDAPKAAPPEVKLVKTDDLKPDDYGINCLRPLGLCDLGGCCDICWYGASGKGASRSPA